MSSLRSLKHFCPSSEAFRSRKSFYESTKKGICCLQTMCTRNKFEINIFSVALLSRPSFLFAFLSDPSSLLLFYTFCRKLLLTSEKNNNNSHPTHLSDLSRQTAFINFLHEPADVARLKTSTLTIPELEWINCFFPSLT